MPVLGRDGLCITTPETWGALSENDPYAVAPADSSAYLQFCVAFGVSDSDPQKLLDMVLGMARGYELGDPTDVVSEVSPLILGAASFRRDEEFARLWEVSDGNGLCSAILIAAKEPTPQVLADAEQIVRSIRMATTQQGKTSCQS